MLNYFSKIAIVALALIIPVASISQDEELTLKDAITGGISPDNLSQLSWIPNSTNYAFVATGGDTAQVEVYDVDGNLQRSFTIGAFQKALTDLDLEEPKNFTAINWIDGSSFWTDCGGSIVEVNIDKGTAVVKVDYEDGAAHKEYHQKSNRLAFTIDNNLYLKSGTSKPVQITAHGDKNIVAGQAIARFEFGITKGIFFSPNGKKVAFYEKDQSEVTDFPQVDYSPMPAQPESFHYPMSGQQSEESKVGVYDVDRDQLVYLKVQGPKDQYLTNLAWDPAGESVYVAVLNRGQDHMKLQRYDAFSGAIEKTLFEEKDDKYVEPENPPYFVEGMDDRFVWISERDGYNHLYLYNTDGSLVRRLTKGEFKVKDIVKAGPKGRWLYFTGTDSPLEIVPYRVKLNSGKVEKLAGNGTHDIKVCEEDDYLIDRFSSIDIPRQIDLTNEKGITIREILVAENPLKDYKIGEAEVFKIAGETDSLYARLIKPSGFSADKKYPVLVYLYNGPHVQLITDSYLASASKWMYYMAEQGYLVFTVDGRGSANRGLEFEQEVFRQLGTLEIEDQLRGVEYLKSLPYVDDDRLAVHGWSYGGFMTLNMMLRQPGTFQVGVAGGAVTDWEYYEVMYTERYMDTPDENEEGYKKADLKNYVNNLQDDLLLVHGLSDDIVVMQHNVSLVSKFIEEGVQFDQFYYPGHGHNVSGKDRVHLIQKVLDYIQVHNE